MIDDPISEDMAMRRTGAIAMGRRSCREAGVESGGRRPLAAGGFQACVPRKDQLHFNNVISDLPQPGFPSV